MNNMINKKAACIIVGCTDNDCIVSKMPIIPTGIIFSNEPLYKPRVRKRSSRNPLEMVEIDRSPLKGSEYE